MTLFFEKRERGEAFCVAKRLSSFPLILYVTVIPSEARNPLLEVQVLFKEVKD